MPASPRAEIGLGTWLDQDAERREGRRGRLAASDGLVPELLWVVLIVGAVLVVGFMLLFADPAERAWVQALMMGSVTAVVVAGLLIAIGFYTRPLALVFAAYTLATALIGHRYWALQGMEQYMAMINFYKNVSIIGGLLLLALTGPGRYSLDRK